MSKTHRALLSLLVPLLPCSLLVAGAVTGCGTSAPAPSTLDASLDGPSSPGSDASAPFDGAFAPDSSATVDAAPSADASPPPLDAATSVDAAPPPPLTTPVTALLPGSGFYPRAILAQSGAILASVVAPQASGHLGGTLLRSVDDGVSFSVIGHVDDSLAAGGLCCATLFQLPKPLGALPAGALLWAASTGGDTPAQPMSIPVWSSTDEGRTWARLSTAVVAAVPRSGGGLWEPEFSMLDDGTLVGHYSDETEAGHSQVLAEVRTSDGVTWGSRTDTVAVTASGERPGMANVRRGPGGRYFMSYELCGTASDSCAAHLRTSTDGWTWGDPTNPGTVPLTVDGHELRHAPTLAYDPTPGQNGRLYMVGQMVYDGAGQVASENGAVVLANTESGTEGWYEVPAPTPVAAPYDNFCPNYSSTLLPLDHGTAALEVASRYDGTDCRAYFARGPLLGSGDDTGVTNASTVRLVSVQSGLCLDVAGGSTMAGSRVEQWTCNGLAPQDWLLTKAGDGTYTLKAQNSGLCLAVAASSPDAGAGVEQDACDGRAGEAWTLRNVGVQSYELARGATGACLDVTGGSTTPGGDIEQWTCNDLSPQIWHFEPQ